MSDYQKPCGYPVMDCALGVYVTKCEDRIEELEKACAEWAEVSQSNYQRAKAAEAKLAKAVEALERLARLGNGERYGNSDGNMIARAILAELTGGKDE